MACPLCPHGHSMFAHTHTWLQHVAARSYKDQLMFLEWFCRFCNLYQSLNIKPLVDYVHQLSWTYVNLHLFAFPSDKNPGISGLPMSLSDPLSWKVLCDLGIPVLSLEHVCSMNQGEIHERHEHHVFSMALYSAIQMRISWCCKVFTYIFFCDFVANVGIHVPAQWSHKWSHDGQWDPLPIPVALHGPASRLELHRVTLEQLQRLVGLGIRSQVHLDPLVNVDITTEHHHF